MTKLSGKIKALIIIGIVTVIALVYSFVHLYNEKLYWQEQAAEYNRYHWSEIYLMAERIENLGFTKETIKEIYPYINAKIFSSITGLYPAFNGDAAYTAVLNTYYVQLAQDISYGNLSEERLVEALVLFADSTDDLKELSQKVLEMTEDTKDIEQGIFTSSTKQRLEELENQKRDLEIEIAQESITRPMLDRDQIKFWFHRFRKMDASLPENRRRLVDSFVNSIISYDDRIEFYFNFKKGAKTLSLEDIKKGSDKLDSLPPTECLGTQTRIGVSSFIELYFSRLSGIFFATSLQSPQRCKSLGALLLKKCSDLQSDCRISFSIILLPRADPPRS